MGTTNYSNTLIAVAADCPSAAAEMPPDPSSVAGVQFAILSAKPPYSLTSDDLLFETHKQRKGLSGTAEERQAFFSKPQACLRASPLPKRFGWAIHHDGEGRIALLTHEGEEYRRLAASDGVKIVPAMRNKRG